MATNCCQVGEQTTFGWCRLEWDFRCFTILPFALDDIVLPFRLRTLYMIYIILFRWFEIVNVHFVQEQVSNNCHLIPDYVTWYYIQVYYEIHIYIYLYIHMTYVWTICIWGVYVSPTAYIWLLYIMRTPLVLLGCVHQRIPNDGHKQRNLFGLRIILHVAWSRSSTMMMICGFLSLQSTSWTSML